ncbi:hypothetical protein PROFUN_14056 [Planoprotostelium fungivorum]|uniref:Uncharacterized protein n=1 Tax=Planoprotostelium fungivorum TaxID=1890364 RepID=A0A2P6N226_9EUKA|nr:hypothetical protein PROFUN_14056 [Planoprotostelium fungivorum]
MKIALIVLALLICGVPAPGVPFFHPLLADYYTAKFTITFSAGVGSKSSVREHDILCNRSYWQGIISSNAATTGMQMTKGDLNGTVVFEDIKSGKLVSHTYQNDKCTSGTPLEGFSSLNIVHDLRKKADPVGICSSPSGRFHLPRPGWSWTMQHPLWGNISLCTDLTSMKFYDMTANSEQYGKLYLYVDEWITETTDALLKNPCEN